MDDDTIPIVPRFQGAMIPVPKGHPARPRSAGARHPYPTRRRVDVAELGWRFGPYAAALICFLGLYFGGGPA